MPGSDTVYNVRVKYDLNAARASEDAKKLAGNLDRAGSSLGSLKTGLAAIGGLALLSKAKSALIDFNSEIDSMKINMSAIMQLQLKMPFEKANIEAGKLFDTFQELAKKSPATTKDFMAMAQAIAAPIAMLGGGPDKLAKLTQGAVIAGQAFGERADIVALDIKQMLAGTVTSRDRIAQQLISSRGMDSTQFNAMESGKRAGLVESMLQDPTLMRAADAMGESMAGQMSTLKDNLQIALGQVGRPLMESITAEVKKWNGWIEKHPQLIKEYVAEFAGMIQGAFTFFKDVAGWFVDNRDTLFSLGKIFLVFRGAGMATNLLKGTVDGIANLKNGLSSLSGILGAGGQAGAVGGFARLSTILTGAGGVIPALGLFAGGLFLVTDLFRKSTADIERLNAKGRSAGFDLSQGAGDIPAMLARRSTLEAKLRASPHNFSAQDQNELGSLEKRLYNPETLGAAIRNISEAAKKHGKGGFEELDMDSIGKPAAFLPDVYDHDNPDKSFAQWKDAADTLKFFSHLTYAAKEEALKYAFPERWGAPDPKKEESPDPSEGWKSLSAKDVNVTIQRVEVASQDPDRFVFGLVKLSERAVKHQTQSAHSIPGGY